MSGRVDQVELVRPPVVGGNVTVFALIVIPPLPFEVCVVEDLIAEVPAIESRQITNLSERSDHVLPTY